MARVTQPGAWPLLLAFTFVLGVTQLLWLNFAPLTAFMQARYEVSELAVSTLTLVFPLLYVVLSLHAGALIDRLGFRRVVSWATVATAVCAALRCFDANFYTLLAAQTGIAIAQPYVNNGISKLVAEWFDERHGALATGIGTVGMFLGMAGALALTPALVESTSLQTALIVFAGVATLAAAVFLLLVKDPALAQQEQATASTSATLLRDANLRKLFVLSFLGLGFFNGLTTWLEPILAVQGIDAERAGLVGGALIVGGIMGAVVIPVLSDKLRRRKPFLVLCTLAAALLTYPLCTGDQFGTLLVLAGLLGFFFLPAYALLLEMCSELSGAASAGKSTGLLMLFGNAGGVLVIVGMQLVRSDDSYLPAVWLLVGLLSVALAVALTVRGDRA